MKLITILFLMFLFLLVGCPGNHKEGSEKIVRIGGNNGIEFVNVIDVDKKTEYGASDIYFKSEEHKFAIVSVPANEEITTYIYAMISPEARTTKMILKKTANKTNFSCILNGSEENNEILRPGSSEVAYEIGIKGTSFQPYSQECINFISAGDDGEDANAESVGDTYEYKQNSIYIIPYPWREIKVKMTKDNSSDFDGASDLSDWLNQNVFNQAICSVKVVSEVDTNYDCLISFSDSFKDNIEFFDENGLEYDKYVSKRVTSANIKYNVGEDTRRKRVAYAIAHIMGVSPDNSQNNLMTENDDDIDHIHLTFRQWNQLHANENGK